MSTPPLSQHSPPSSSAVEPAAVQRRITLTVKPLKSKSAASTSSIHSHTNDTTPTASSSSTRNPITLKIKPSRSNSIAGPSRVHLQHAQDEEKKALPKLILKPPKPPTPVANSDTMEVDDIVPLGVQTPLVEEIAKEEPSVEILAPPSPPAFTELSRTQPLGKVKAPRPIKLKPLKEVLRKLIAQVKKKDDYAFFLTPVDTSQIPGYLDVIKQPMDFGTMTEKVEKGQYRSLEQFKGDFLLVTSNAKTFNPEPSIYYSEASKIEAWGLDQITKAAVHVIEYEADWTIDVVTEERPTISAANEVDNGAADGVVLSGEAPTKTRSPSVMSSAVGTPNLPAERSKKSRKKGPIVTESWEEGGHLPGVKDGVGAFPPCSDLSVLMLELKLKGKRFRTKKERLKREKEGPPFAADGSLDYTEMENPFTVLRQLVPQPLDTPELIPLIPTHSTPLGTITNNRELSLPPEGKPEVKVDGPAALPPEALPGLLSDPDRYAFVNAPASTAVVGKKQLRHWTVTRNPPRATRARDEEEEAALTGLQTKRRRIEHSDFGTFASLLGTIAAENGLTAEDFEDVFSNDEKVLEQIRRSIESRDLKAATMTQTDLGDKEKEDLLDADEYIRDIVYGGAGGLAYFRSLAEFVGEYYDTTEGKHASNLRPGELGMPLARWVTENIVDSLTGGNHSTLRAVAETLARANAQGKGIANADASYAIARYLSLANEDKSSVIEQIRELEALAEPSAKIDMAALLRKPEELFLAENEWVVRERKQGSPIVDATNVNSTPPTTISGSGASAGPVLNPGFASSLPGQSYPSGVFVGDSGSAIEHALSDTAGLLRDLGQRISEYGQDTRSEIIKGEGEWEDSVMRRARLILIALAKRAPIDRIARLPPELVPVHIRHIVPTLGS